MFYKDYNSQLITIKYLDNHFSDFRQNLQWLWLLFKLFG